ncbi:hypothetical protein [Shewanella surugensis]|uniref:SLATT domain-containing protein n=1 Tax=Shewanella surugensis TaxID=212020 RepID=A0ABT0L8F5_9GAMM|nr:hypothetical protein [Shewanella surugensis]MCL1123655.1 hypothetical protein [Shewanella surugensis]
MKCKISLRCTSDIEDKRINTQAIADDKAYAELDYYLQQYKHRERRFSWRSKLTRKIATYSLPLVVLSTLGMLLEKHVDIILPSFLICLAALKAYLPLIAVGGLTLFCWAYFANHLSGFTRGWSRNRLMREHLEQLIREYQLAIVQKDEAFIHIEQDNILCKLSQLEEQNRIQTHKDIVGDYHTANTGVMNWLKIKK